ncbi:hypothetical protein DYB32_000932 [Aphanomyces invadans]|uniref:Ion transport domain-containing protein n=1 Tax=Aphanomyces invadans TaxID=157072 RepID=A0A3R6WT36_9STRA|nr:hypothetical protein DYB32_000932 [Aphanomyces invadans]
MSDVQDKGGTVMPLPDSVEDDNANATRLPLPEMCESMAPIQESKSTSIPEDSAVIPAPFAPPPEIPPSPSRTSSRILSVSSRLNSDDRAKTFRSRMRVKLVDNPEGSRIGRFYHNGFLAIIVCNLIGLMLETLDGPNHGSSDPMYPMLPFSKSYVQSDMFFTGIFTLDLIVKCAIAKSQKQFWTSIVTIMDVLAVLPLYIIAVKAGTLRMSNTEIQLPSEQYIKLLRLFRIIRTAHRRDSVATVGYGDQIVDLNNITAVIVVCVMMIFGALYLAMPLAIVGIKYEMLWTQHESERKLKIRADSYRTTGKPPPSELNQIIHIDSMRLVPMSNAINVQFVEFCELASVLSRDCAKFVSLAVNRNRDEATTKLIDTLLRAIKAHKALSRTVESLVPRELLKPNALAKQPNVSETSPSRHSTFKQTMISRAKRALSGAAHPDDTAQHDPNAKLPFRRRLFLLLERPHSSRQANYVNKFFLITVILSMLLFYAETTPELQAYGMSTELCHRALESYCKQSSITPSTDPGCFVYSSPTVSTSTKLNFHCHPDEVADALNVSPCISLGWNYGSNTSAIVCSKSFSDTEKICNLRQCRPNHVPMFDMSTKWLYFECYFGFVFTAEWFLRFYAARHRLAFVRSFGTCIDTFAITPFYAEIADILAMVLGSIYTAMPLSLIGGQFYACYEQYLKDRDSSRRNGGSVAYTSVGGVTAKKQRRRTVIGAEDVPTLSQFVALSRLLNAVILNACRLNTMAAQPAKIGNNALPLPPLLDSVVHNTEKTVQSMRRFSSSRRNSNPDAVLMDAIAATRVYEKKVQTVNALINNITEACSLTQTIVLKFSIIVEKIVLVDDDVELDAPTSSPRRDGRRSEVRYGAAMTTMLAPKCASPDEVALEEDPGGAT